MARVILTTAGEDVTVGGTDIDVIGTSADGEIVTIIPGSNVTLDASFAAGGDAVRIDGEAEDYSAALVGSRVVLTDGDGTTISIPVGSNGIGITFGGDDTRTLVVEGGVVTLGGQNITSEEVSLDAGTDTEDSLSIALTALSSAQAALGTFLEENEADDVNELRNDADTLEGQLNLARTNDGSLAELRADVTGAEAQVDAIESDISDVDGLEQAIADFRAAEIAVDDAQAALTGREARLAAETAGFEALYGVTLTRDPATGEISSDIAIDESGSTTSTEVVVLNDDGNLVLGAAALDENGDPLVDAPELLQATINVEAAEADLDAANTALTTANDALNEIDGGAALEQDLEDAEDAVAAAETAVDDRVDLIQDFNSADAVADQAESLAEDIDDAEQTITDLGFAQPITVGGGDNVAGTADSDIFLLGDVEDGSASITDFDAAGDDLLFVGGNAYTVVRLEDTDDITTESLGNSGTLEVFIQDTGADTVLYFEDETFSGNTSDGSFQGLEVTLVGVDADFVDLDTTGYITVEDTAVV